MVTCMATLSLIANLQQSLQARSKQVDEGNLLYGRIVLLRLPGVSCKKC
jgi:hypothetical protein